MFALESSAKPLGEIKSGVIIVSVAPTDRGAGRFIKYSRTAPQRRIYRDAAQTVSALGPVRHIDIPARVERDTGGHPKLRVVTWSATWVVTDSGDRGNVSTATRWCSRAGNLISEC